MTTTWQTSDLHMWRMRWIKTWFLKIPMSYRRGKRGNSFLLLKFLIKSLEITQDIILVNILISLWWIFCISNVFTLTRKDAYFKWLYLKESRIWWFNLILHLTIKILTQFCALVKEITPNEKDILKLVKISTKMKCHARFLHLKYIYLYDFIVALYE